MVKRYSHKAIITVSSGHLEHGEWVEGPSADTEVLGQYFPSNSGNKVKLNKDGKEFIVKGEFSTQHKEIERATQIKIKSIGLDAKIESWEPFQTHSVIYI